MSQAWDATLTDLEARRRKARAMGGPAKLARHRDSGKLDARTRINLVADKGSFTEIGTLAGPVPADAFVAGVATIEGRPVAVGAEDFTTLGGSIGPAATRKRWRIADIAGRERIPLVMLLEGAGHRPPMPADPGGGGPNDLQIQASLSGLVPMVCGVLGPSAGHGAVTALLCDFSVMTPQASIFTAGPPVVEASLGERVSKEDLGGPGVAIGAGTIHNQAGDDLDLLQQIRAYLSYFGSSAWERPPYVDTGDTDKRRIEHILGIVPRDPRQAYDMYEVVELISDLGEIFEIQGSYGPSIICVLARIGGHSVGIVANQPLMLAGSIDTAAATKAAHFISVCDSFHLPLVFLSDNPGVLAGSASEGAGVLRASARMYAAQTTANIAKIHVTLRKAFGFGSCVMAMNPHDAQTLSFAFPAASVGAMGAAGAGRAVRASEQTSADLRQAEQESAYRSASGLSFDEVIDPRELRNAILTALELSQRRRSHPAEPKRHTGISP